VNVAADRCPPGTEYLADPRDRALLGATPTLMAPRFGRLPPPIVGQHRFVAGAGGLYLQGRSRALDVALRVADTPFPLPYGQVPEGVLLRHGALGQDLLLEAEARARATAPREWAGVVVLDHDGSYRLVEPPPVWSRTDSVRYRVEGFDPEALVLDLHSHGDGEAYFSATDDASDREGGIYLAAVIGRCRDKQPTWAWRLVVNGLFFSMADASIAAIR